MKKMDSIKGKHLSVALGIMVLTAGWAYGETTITDSYYVAGKLRPIIGIQAGSRGQWTKAPYAAFIGLERIPGSKKPGIYGYRLVLDTSAMEGVIPAPCVQRFEQPWDALREHFPVWPGETKHEHPPEDALWQLQSEAQRFEFSNQGCSVRLWLGNVCPYGIAKLPNGTPALGTDYPGLSGKEFPNLFINKVISVNRGRLEFTAKSQKVELNFLAHHEDISNLKYVSAP